MIDTFLRAPRGAAEVFADTIRIVGLASFAVAALLLGLVETAVFALSLLGLVFPRFLGARAALDASFGIVVLVAAWSSVLDLYTTVPGWDILIHFLTNGLAAAVAFVLFAGLTPRTGQSAPRGSDLSRTVLTTAFGLSIGVLWEFAEWMGHTFVDQSIFVNYDDTIGDLAAGGAGSFVAGCAMRFLAANNRSVRNERDLSAVD